MALSQKLEIRQSQALVMTPQLMQAIKLLQLSNLDLSAYVDNELERNPLLERTAETEAAEAERRSADGASSQQSTEEWAERPVDAVDNAPSGRVISDSHSIGLATTTATASGYISPKRFGTSSPKMIVMIA